MTNTSGLRVRFLSYGGVITEIEVPDRAGQLANIVLGLSNLHDYETLSSHYGAITGRYANRIANARFSPERANIPPDRQQRRQHAAWWTECARQAGLDGRARSRW